MVAASMGCGPQPRSVSLPAALEVTAIGVGDVFVVQIVGEDKLPTVKAYRSKRVEVLGEVRKPGSLPLEPGMTLLRAISQAGGFNSLAAKSRVTVRRKVVGGKTVVAIVDVTAIVDNSIADIALQAGDAIIVGQRVF
jgi:polysaccharide export outer membrane protein